MLPTAQNLADFADACCEDFGLSDEAKEDVLQTARVRQSAMLDLICLLISAFYLAPNSIHDDSSVFMHDSCWAADAKVDGCRFS